MKKILSLLLILAFAPNNYAQSMRQMMVSMPDSIMPLLTKVNREDCMDYLDSKSHKAWRPIAWCSFLTGKYDQARNYYKKIIAHQPSEQDWLNAGHTEWALQNIKGALYCYEEAVRKANGGFQAFLELFNQDIPDLLIAGIDLSEVPLMLDLLKYIDNGEMTIEN